MDRCIKLCTEIGKTYGKFSLDSKYCVHCAHWFIQEYQRCPCCSQLLRTKSRQWYKHKRTLTQGTERILFSKPLRRGKCTDCLRKIGDEFIDVFGNKKIIRQTTLHHTAYDNSNILKNTIELCRSCHRKRHVGINSNFTQH
jgi:hypothetical protein